jgi:hypothetical protein
MGIVRDRGGRWRTRRIERDRERGRGRERAIVSLCGGLASGGRERLAPFSRGSRGHNGPLGRWDAKEDVKEDVKVDALSL